MSEKDVVTQSVCRACSSPDSVMGVSLEVNTACEPHPSGLSLHPVSERPNILFINWGLGFIAFMFL